MRSRQAGQTTGSTRCESVVQEVVGQIWFARSESGGVSATHRVHRVPDSPGTEPLNCAVGLGGVGDCDPSMVLGRHDSESDGPEQRSFRNVVPRTEGVSSETVPTSPTAFEVGSGAPIEGPRMASQNESGSNRFVAEETVPAGTQELEVRVPDTIIDALAVDLERPSRRLVLMSGGHQTLVAGEDTVTTQPAEGPLPTWVDEVGGGRNTFPRSATQVDSVTDENTLYVRQAPGAQSQPEVFPMSDDADVEVATVAGQVGGPRRVVLVPLSPGTPRSVQDRTQIEDRLEAGSEGGSVSVGSHEEARRVVPPGERVGSERESEGWRHAHWRSVGDGKCWFTSRGS